MKIKNPFVFCEVMQSDSEAFIAEISEGIKTKETLLDELSKRLHFPNYFGGNWDALEECVRDLSWISENRINIKHFDIPIVNDVRNLRIYLSIIKDAVLYSQEHKRKELIVYFPEVAEDRIDWLLR